MIRIGIGYDIHRLVEGRPLILGGVTIPFDKGLEGHSDGDALAHAIIDALFGAAALGNIGQHFPNTDAQYKDADSMALLEKTRDLIHGAGYSIVNIDANVVLEQPKLNPHVNPIRRSIAACLELELGQVSVKPRTNEQAGPEGRGEAISVQAVVLLETA